MAVTSLGCSGAVARVESTPEAGRSERRTVRAELVVPGGEPQSPVACDADEGRPCPTRDEPFRVEARWSAGADIELRIREPSGFVLGAMARSSPQGGQVDRTSRGACDDEPAPHVESAHFGELPEEGQLEIWLDFAEACGGPQTVPIEVTFAVDGRLVTSEVTLTRAQSRSIGVVQLVAVEP